MNINYIVILEEPKATYALSLFVFAGQKMDMMIQIVARPNTIPTGQDRETLTFKALLCLNVGVHAQVCRLFCVVYMPLFDLVQVRPWPSSILHVDLIS